jgi:colicin import membrane protein
MEPLLRIADELERRDAAAADALAEVERRRQEVEETRAQAGAAAAFLAALPGALAAAAEEEQTASEAVVRASETLREAEELQARAEERGKEEERLAAARAVQQARDGLHEAELRLERARGEHRGLEREGEKRRREAEALLARAQELAAALGRLPRVAPEAAAPPGPGLDGVLDWAARARGGLLVARAGLATERDAVVREATELVASVSGEPLAATGVAGVRARLERALAGS